MPGFYIYTLGHDGHVQGRMDVVCDNDEQAKRRAELLVDGQALELWHEARKIAEFKPHKQA